MSMRRTEDGVEMGRAYCGYQDETRFLWGFGDERWFNHVQSTAAVGGGSCGRRLFSDGDWVAEEVAIALLSHAPALCY